MKTKIVFVTDEDDETVSKFLRYYLMYPNKRFFVYSDCNCEAESIFAHCVSVESTDEYDHLDPLGSF